MGLSQEKLKQFYKELTVQLDSNSFKKIFEKYIDKGIVPTIYIEENDNFAFDFYKEEIKKADFEISISKMPIIPDADFVNSVKENPGVVASVLINNENGISGTPYLAAGHPNYELETYPSYFNILGLLALGDSAMAKNIAGNLTYQIGHVYTLKPTNSIEHQALTASPVYTSLIKSIALTMKSEEERRQFLKIHIMRSILEYNRQWNTDSSLLENGLNVYPSHATKETSTIHVKLNMMLYNTEKDLEHFIKAHTENNNIEVEGKVYNSEYWKIKAEERLAKINAILWDNDTNTYNDYDLESNAFINKERANFIYALWAKSIEKNKAQELIDHHLSDFTNNGVFNYNKENTSIETPEQILFWEGLLNYKFNNQLKEYAKNWLELANANYAEYESLPMRLDFETKMNNLHTYSWTVSAYVLAKQWTNNTK